MVTENDLKTLDIMVYLLENLRPALNAMKDKRRSECRIRDLGSIEYCAERTHADLRKVRRLAMLLIKDIE